MNDTTVADSEPARRWTWDFSLVVLTVALLGGLGLQSLLGTLYVWWAQRTAPGWDQLGYPAFVTTMNVAAAPMVVGLVLVMGLCVPRRLFTRTALLVASGAMLLAGLAAWVLTGSGSDGLAAYLVAAGAIQLAVVALTAAGTSSLTYLTEGRVTKLGSGLLHLGIIVFAYVVVALQDSTRMLPVFWVAFVLAMGGTALSFYSNAVSRALRPDKADEGSTAP